MIKTDFHSHQTASEQLFETQLNQKNKGEILPEYNLRH